MPDDFRKYAAEAFRQMDEGAEHPATQEIDAHLHGRLPDRRRTAMEAHLAQCAGCRERVSEFKAFLKDCEQPAAIPQRTLEEEYGRLASRLPAPKVVRMPRRWLALAAAVVLPLGLAGAIWWLTPSTPRLLAQAYRERRTSEFRIAGAAYAELRQERAGGSAFSMPVSLLKAQARIQDDLKAHENDPELLRLEGEAQIIGGDAAGAVKSLSRARELRSGDAQILSDLGSAYSILGDVEHDFDDYKQGLDLLDQSLRLGSRNFETLFNRAVVLEKLMLFDQAEIAWNDYLKSDPAGDWAQEARKRLAAVQQKMQQREKKLGEVRDDPAHFLKLAASDGADAEAWLISPIPIAWLMRSAADPNARPAVLKLADLLVRKHGDTWLRDMTADSCAGPAATAALGKLMAADAQASAGQYDAALIASEEAAREFLQAGCGAGATSARLSLIGAKQNSARTAECSSDADQLNRELHSLSYVRIRARLARASAVCAMRQGRLDEADATLRQALQMSRAAGYGATSLDLFNVNVAKTSAPGLPSQIVANAAESLRLFWSGAYRRDLMYAPVYELRLFANRAEQKGAALYFARSAVWATRDSILMYQVQTYSALAVAERDLAMMQEAGADLETSNRLSAKLPDGYRVPPAVALARLDLDRGNASQALERLLPWAETVPRMPVVDRASYYAALGESLVRNGSLADAVAAFRKITESSETYLATVKSGDERDGVLKGIEGAYRGLVAAQLATPGNETAALATWRSYRALEAPQGSPAHAPSEGPVLWYVELPDGFAIWCTSQGQTVFHRMEAPKAAVDAVAHRFLKESSDPQSSVEATRDDARMLYRWMVAPFRFTLGTVGQNLIVEPDGALGALPLQSLLAEDGSYLGDRYAVLISAGRAGRPHASTPADAQVLVVANPLIAGASAVRFPPLPDTLREAQAIRGTFGNGALLEGRAASVEALARELPHADILHFAGHGYSSSGNGGLLLAPANPAVADYRLVGASDLRSMDWSRCSLVVLSACAAAEGEARGAHNPESLIRALAKAGVPRIAASLWNADSAATAELMSQFYGSLKNGCQPAEALRTAQQALRRNPRWQHPYYWAGFQLYGTT